MDVALFVLSVGLWYWKNGRAHKEETIEGDGIDKDSSPEYLRLLQLLESGEFLHPYLKFHAIHNRSTSLRDRVPNLVDLSQAIASCCGVQYSTISDNPMRQELVSRLGGSSKNHIVLIVCDGLGVSSLKDHLSKDSFLRQHLSEMRAVFPPTTPASLTTLATGEWPGQHGVPGWDLRDQKECEYPGQPTEMIQMRVLAQNILDVRYSLPVQEHQCQSWDDIFLVKPWASKILSNNQPACEQRQLLFINAYSGSDAIATTTDPKTTTTTSAATTFPRSGVDTTRFGTDFSVWQSGEYAQMKGFLETDSTSVGSPEGAEEAVQYFATGIDITLRAIQEASASNRKSFTYLYTAHPDKHMHLLGTKHPYVGNIISGIDHHVKRLWHGLQRLKMDATVLLTADHGHITVTGDDLVVLPDRITECLEYANVGIYGKGRHAYLHCKAGMEEPLRTRWREESTLNRFFLLLSIDEAARAKLFGPAEPRLSVRPRLGHFVAIAMTNRTLVTNAEYKSGLHQRQGAHGSLISSEMAIPLIMLGANDSDCRTKA